MRRLAINLARRRGRLLLAVLAVLGLGASAFAFWSSQGSGTASGSIGTLSAPVISSAAPGAGTVELSWSAVTPPGSGSVSYYVSRDGGAPAGNCPSSSAPAGVTSCTDAEVSAGTHEYTVTAVWRSWTARSAAKSVEVATATATHLVLEASTTSVTAGASDALTITAKDASNKTVTSYSGTKSLTFGGASTIGSFHPTVTNSSGTATNFGSVTAITFNNGVSSVAGSQNGVMALYKAETAAVTVTDGTISNGGGLSIAVSPAGAASFSVPTPATQTAGSAFEETLTALDAYGNTATGYTGTKTISFSGPASSPNSTAPKYPASVSFSAGSGQASITLYKAESTALTAKEGSISGSSGSFTVNPTSASSFSLPTPGAQTAGGTFEQTLTALDAYGNAATGYSGSKTIAFSGPSSSPNSTAPKYPASVSFSSGIGKASITLYKAESTTLTAKEGSISGSTGSFTINPATAASLSLSAASTTPTAGEADNLTIAAVDAYGNAATAYTGAHSLTFGGASTIGANKPTVSSSSGTATAFGTATSITFTSGTAKVSGANNGVMTLYSAETAKVTVTDGTITNGTGLSVTVAPAAIASIAVTTPATQAAGTAFNLAITAKDTYGNGVSGSQALTFSGPASSPNATAPTYPTGVSFTNGSGSASVTLTDAQSTTITVKQGAIGGTSGSFTVNPASAASFALSTPATQTAGTAFTETLTALDTFGNTATGYKEAHTITFSGPANSPSGKAPTYPASVTFTSGKGEASITLFDAQSTTLSAKEGSLVGTSGSFTVNPASAASFALSTPATQTAGTAFTETLTALDTFGNTATGYKEAHTITFSGPANSPSGKAPTYPASVTFTSGKGEASITLFDAQSTTLSAKEGTISGASGSFTVNGATASVMSLANCKVAGTTVACTEQPFKLGNGGSGKRLTANIALLDAYGNVPKATTATINLTSGNSEYTITSSVLVSSGTESSQLTVEKTGSANSNATLTAKATGFADLTFTASK